MSNATFFVSYSRVDQAFVQRLTQDLHQMGLSYWLDINEIEAGGDWMDSINAALETCELMLLILSPASMNSPQVADEWKYFINNNKPLIPILFRPVQKIHYKIGAYHYIDFHETDYKTAFGKLQAEIARRLPELGSQSVSKVKEDATLKDASSDITEQMERESAKLAASSDNTGPLDPRRLIEHEEQKKHRTGEIEIDPLFQYSEQLHYFDENMTLELSAHNQQIGLTDIKVVSGEELIVGRSSQTSRPDIDLSTFDADQYGVSRQHAALRLESNTLYIEDKRSTNSTFLNQTRLLPNERRALKNGDWLQLGKLLVIVSFKK